MVFRGFPRFENLADAIASMQQSFGTQEQFIVALNLLKNTPTTQITKCSDLVKASHMLQSVLEPLGASISLYFSRFLSISIDFLLKI